MGQPTRLLVDDVERAILGIDQRHVLVVVREVATKAVVDHFPEQPK